MNTKLKAVFVAPLFCFFLGGCSELTEAFLKGNPAQVSDCDVLMGGGLNGSKVMCVECDSGDTPENSVEKCGVQITARCNSAATNDVYGVALGGFEVEPYNFSVLTATAWYDKDGNGADTGDVPVCHQQSGIVAQNKHEFKCTSALTGPGKDGNTFEVDVKYDASMNECL